MAPADNEPPETPNTMPSRQEFDALVSQANAGSEEAIVALRRLLDDNPQIWQAVGDLSRHAEASIVAAVAKGDRLAAEAIQRQAEAMRSELLGPSASPLENLAINRVVTAWLALQYAESRHPQDGSTSNLTLVRYLEQLKSGAQNRFDAALKSLLLVREKLAVIQRAEKPTLRILRTGT